MDYAALRVAGYVRVSTEEQAIHGLSVDAQTAALHHWAEAHGAQLVKIYTDAGISGRKKAVKRPALTRLLEDVQADRLDLIIFTKLDRWFRNVGEYYKVQEVLEAHAVNWCTVQEEYDTASASGRLKINIMLSVAQDEADRTGERIKAVFARKRELGEVCGGRAPRGYRIENKRLVFDPEWKPAMELFFRSYFADWSAVAARNTVQAQTGKVISYQVARLLLRNEIYCGTLYGVPGACPAYITREQFAEIQKLKRRSTHRARTGRVYLFTGLLFCGECGGSVPTSGAKAAPSIHTSPISVPATPTATRFARTAPARQSSPWSGTCWITSRGSCGAGWTPCACGQRKRRTLSPSPVKKSGSSGGGSA